MRLIQHTYFFCVIAGDAFVAEEKFDDGDPFWGTTILLLMFVPNIAFFGWFIHGSGSNLCNKNTITKLVAAAFVQVITIFR